MNSAGCGVAAACTLAAGSRAINVAITPTPISSAINSYDSDQPMPGGEDQDQRIGDQQRARDSPASTST